MYVYCMKRSARADVNQLIFLPCQKVTAKLAVIFLKNGGPNRDRTDDLTDANRTLSRGGKFSAHGLRHVGRLYNVRMDYNFLAKTRTANDALKVLHIRFIQLCLE